MTKKWRAAVIACGRMSRAHGRAFASLPEVELVACADISAEALERFGEEFDIPEEGRYLDYREMMEAQRPDLVSICSLHHQHAEMTIAAASFKPRGILCEKPIAVSLGEADAMIEACKLAGTRLIIGHQRRYNAQYVAAYEALQAGRIGELLSLESHGHPGSSLMVDGTHTIDLLRWYAGEGAISWVFGQIDTRESRTAWGTRIENAAMVMFGLENGLCALHTNGGAPVAPGDSPLRSEHTPVWPEALSGYYHRIILRGSEGEIHIDGDWRPAASPPRKGPLVSVVRDGQVSELPAERHEVHSLIVRDLIDCIESGAPHTLDAHSARATLEVIMAAYESSRRRAVIPLPLGVEENPLFAMLEAGEI